MPRFATSVSLRVCASGVARYNHGFNVHHQCRSAGDLAPHRQIGNGATQSGLAQVALMQNGDKTFAYITGSLS